MLAAARQTRDRRAAGRGAGRGPDRADPLLRESVRSLISSAAVIWLYVIASVAVACPFVAAVCWAMDGEDVWEGFRTGCCVGVVVAVLGYMIFAIST